MRKQDIIDYCLKTPYNTNPNLLNQFLDNLSAADSSAEEVERGDAIVYGVVIDTYNGDRDASIEYVFDAAKMEAGPDAWFDRWPFNEIRPCVFKDGEVAYYLNSSDFSKKENGGSANLDGTDGDVMIEFPRVAYSVGYDRGGRYLTVCITNKKVDLEKFYMQDKEFCNYAFSRGTGIKDKMYIGAFLDCANSSGNIGSYSGFVPVSSQTLNMVLERGRSKGEGYFPVGYYQMSLIQILYLIMYKNLGSCSQIGYGRCGQEGTSTALATGVTLDKGMNTGKPTWGDQNKEIAAKLFGIEDIYGNLTYIVGGVAKTTEEVSSYSYRANIFASNKYFDNDNIIKNGNLILKTLDLQASLGGSRVIGKNDSPFFSIGASSEYTFFEGTGDMAGGDSFYMVFGKDYQYAKEGGLFNTRLICGGGLPEDYGGSRLMYL